MKSQSHAYENEQKRIESIYMTAEAMLFSMEFFVLGKILEKRPKKILDVGCGHAKILSSIKRHRLDCQYVGIDIRDMSKYIQAVNTTFIQLDIVNEWLYPSFKCDCILFSEVIEHLNKGDGEMVLENIYKTLERNGILILTTPAMQIHTNMVVEKKKFGHIHYWDFEKLKELCSSLGFNIKESWSARFLGDRHSTIKIEKLFLEHYGAFTLAVFEDVKSRFGQLIAKSIFAHIIPQKEASHIQLVLEKPCRKRKLKLKLKRK